MGETGCDGGGSDRDTKMALPILVALILGLAGEAQAQCTTSLTGGVNTRTCTGTITGQQQVRGSNTEEKLILQSGSITSSGNGILGRDDSGTTTVTVQLDGGTVAAGGIGINFDMGRSASHPNGRSNIDINGGTITAGGTGVNINHRPASTGGRITFSMSGGSIGLENNRVGTIGLSAGIQAPSNSQAINIDMTGGSVYATQRGLQLSHGGTGEIDLDIGSRATINTSGTGNRGAAVFISRNGAGSIDVNNAGTITSAGHDGIFVLNSATGATPISLTHTGTITAANFGIYVRQGSSSTSGHGEVSITSGGDITTRGSVGILLDLSRGDVTADDAISVRLTGGTILAASAGVQVSSHTRGSLTFGMTGGTIGTSGAPIGQTGISLALTSTTNTNVLDVNLTSGTIFARFRGLQLSHAGTGDIDLDLGTDSRITTTRSTAQFTRDGVTRTVFGAGVYAFHSGSGAIDIRHAGTITNAGNGIQAVHSGSGALTITNSGTIGSAGHIGIFATRTSPGTLTVTHTGTITTAREPGIFVRHDAPRTTRNHDVVLTIKGDVTTNAPGHAAVRADTRTPTATAGVRITHTSGTLTGFRGIFATEARFTGSTHGAWPGDASEAPLASTPTARNKIWISVGRDARINARGTAAGGADQLPEVDRVTRGLVGINTFPSGITIGGGDYVLVGRFIAEGDGNIALTREERAVVEAVYGTGDLETALAGLPTDPYDNTYKDTVRWYAGAFNDASYRVDVEGTITSAGDGIRIVRRHIHDRNGIAAVTIHEGGSVSARRYGVRLRGAGMHDTGVRSQYVDVFGDLASTGPDGAAIALRGGGHVTIGADSTLQAISGTAILVDAPDPGSSVSASCTSTEVAEDGACPPGFATDRGANLIIRINQKENEDLASAFARAVPGRIVNTGGATRVFVVDDENQLRLLPIRISPTPPPPAIGDVPAVGDTATITWLTSQAPVPAPRLIDGAHDAWMDCDGRACTLRTTLAPRARIAGALPAILLDLNTSPLADAPRAPGGTGFHARILGAAGDRDLKDATAAASYSLDRRGLALGHDLATPAGTLSLTLRRQTGSAAIGTGAAMEGGTIGTVATGLAVAHSWALETVTVALHAAATAFTSDLATPAGTLASGLGGRGLAAGVEAATRRPLGEATLTVGGGLFHQRVTADGFTAGTGNAAVRVAGVRGETTTARLRADWSRPRPAGSVFAGARLDVPLDGSAAARVGATPLTSKPRAALGVQGGLVLDGAALALGYETTGASDSLHAGLSVRF